MSAKLVLRGLRLLEKHKEQPVKKKTIQKNNKSKRKIQKRQRETSVDIYKKNLKLLLKQKEKKADNPNMEKILDYFNNRSRPTKLHTKQNSAEESDFTEADMQFEDHSELFDDDEYAEDEAERKKKKKKPVYVRKR